MLDRRNWSGWLRRIGFQGFQAPSVAESVQQVIVVRDESALADYVVGPTGRGGGNADGGSGPIRIMIAAGSSGCHVLVQLVPDGAVPESYWSKFFGTLDDYLTAFPGTVLAQTAHEISWADPQNVGTTRLFSDEMTAPTDPTGFDLDVIGNIDAHRQESVGATNVSARDNDTWEWIPPNRTLVFLCGALINKFGVRIREPGAVPQ